MLSFLEQAEKFHNSTAIVAGESRYSYGELLASSASFSYSLLSGDSDLRGARVAFMVEPGFDYVKTMWAIWQAGGVAVPLCLSHPLPSLKYYIEDTGAAIIVVSPVFESILGGYCQEQDILMIVLGNEEKNNTNHLPDVVNSRRALILYTSGTTNKPKGVVLTHKNLEAQITTLVSAWKWTSMDHTVCVLPLHHIHGIVNIVGCSLWSGATCEFLPSFSAEALFNIFKKKQVNVFMAVPTIYFKLISFLETLSSSEQNHLKDLMSGFRLMVSGSAALPVKIMEQWKSLSGHKLLERYGMTEIGMAISNPYEGERRPGYVGLPLPGVEIRLADEFNNSVGAGTPGEIQVKGENVFLEYWNKEAATKESFTEDGWFRTGDIAIVENDYYKIMGRNSVDIIKSGGYKISALEIEEVIRNHDSIEDCAVVGIPDEEWGELIVAAVVINENCEIRNIESFLLEQLPSYKLPRKFLELKELPRNTMGKVIKNEVKNLFV
jgi:malonyl-CoA/methylmalonyl-CoA synthetase